jgi:hypothetical protein
VSEYVFQSGEQWPPPPPEDAPQQAKVGTASERLRARAQRARLDPAWRSRSAASKENLVNLDVREARERRRKGGQP